MAKFVNNKVKLSALDFFDCSNLMGIQNQQKLTKSAKTKGSKEKNNSLISKSIE